MSIPNIPDIPGPFQVVGSPPPGFRFGVMFFALGIGPNPIDSMFQKVSGLGSSVETYTLNEGGQHMYTQMLPDNIKHENLLLERGLFVGSPLVQEFNTAMSLFKFKSFHILITLLDNTRLPVASWMCMKAFPVKWSVSDLDATENAVVIEYMELTYQRLQTIRI
jgi:phage tail-like protein